MIKEAMFYQKLNDNKVRCNICNNRCSPLPGKRGKCGVRENQGGKLYSLVYGKAVANYVDPVEKKPLFHFYPGSRAYSIGTVGCNFCCMFCQNWEISQVRNGAITGRNLLPEEVVDEAIASGCQSVAYTYTEPTIFYEYAFDSSRIAHKKGLKNLFITNGYISEEALKAIAPYLDAANIDLKSMNDHFYRNICRAKLQPVLENIKLYYKLGVWIEITTLVIPGHNDSPEELRDIAEFIKDINPDIPWHISRFYPAYRMSDVSPTSLSTIRKAVDVGKAAGLRYVYEGNIGEGENTYCPHCGKLLIERHGFAVTKDVIKDGNCPYCGESIPGRGMSPC